MATLKVNLSVCVVLSKQTRFDTKHIV